MQQIDDKSFIGVHPKPVPCVAGVPLGVCLWSHWGNIDSSSAGDVISE